MCESIRQFLATRGVKPMGYIDCDLDEVQPEPTADVDVPIAIVTTMITEEAIRGQGMIP